MKMRDILILAGAAAIAFSAAPAGPSLSSGITTQSESTPSPDSGGSSTTSVELGFSSSKAMSKAEAKSLWQTKHAELQSMVTAAKGFRVQYVDPFSSAITRLTNKAAYVRAYPGEGAANALVSYSNQIASLEAQRAPWWAHWQELQAATEPLRAEVAQLRRLF